MRRAYYDDTLPSTARLIRHIAAGPSLTRPITDTEFCNLDALALIAPCAGCTQSLGTGEIVYHPNLFTLSAADALTEIRAVLREKKH